MRFDAEEMRQMVRGMSDYDSDIAIQTERDGVRTTSGHHMGGDDMGWTRHVRADHLFRRLTPGDTYCKHCGLHESADCHEPPDYDPHVDRPDHYER